MTYMTINGKRIILENEEDFTFAVRGEGTEIHVRCPRNASLTVEVNDIVFDREEESKS